MKKLILIFVFSFLFVSASVYGVEITEENYLKADHF